MRIKLLTQWHSLITNARFFVNKLYSWHIEYNG